MIANCFYLIGSICFFMGTAINQWGVWYESTAGLRANYWYMAGSICFGVGTVINMLSA